MVLVVIARDVIVGESMGFLTALKLEYAGNENLCVVCGVHPRVYENLTSLSGSTRKTGYGRVLCR